jgi:AraC-like DNA-binding protein
MTFYFVQPETVKYNSYIYSKHPDWQILHANPVVSDDPLGIRNYINTLTAIHFVLYLALTVSILWIRNPADKENMNDFNLKKLQSLKFSTIHFVIILVIFVSTKLYFGRDLGDHFIAIYITLMFFITTLQIIQYSTYFQTTHSFLEVPVKKYSKSSLDEKRKNELLASIKHEMEKNKFYADPLASLSNLAKRLHETNHHISQVINEKMNKTFYELLASCRIEEAKKILVNPQNAHLTVEEIAEKVGYNSKSAFNNAFKKLTGKTPSAFRKTRE